MAVPLGDCLLVASTAASPTAASPITASPTAASPATPATPPAQASTTEAREDEGAGDADEPGDEEEAEEGEAEDDEASARLAQLSALRAATRLQLSHERLARRAAQEKLNEQVRTHLRSESHDFTPMRTTKPDAPEWP